MFANFWWHNGETRKTHWISWRKLCKPKSQDGQVLLAPVGRNPSYTWRSIQAAQQVVRGGLRWRIHSGRSVRIRGDPWIPRPFSFSVLSPPNAAFPDMRVCDLIDATTKEWNHGLLRELFWQEDIDAILAIPLSLIDGEDFFIWHHTPNGLFSVRSAYHVALSLAHQPLPSSSNLASPVWKTIWKANVPSKIRVFIRKVAHNALPTDRNLLQKLRFEPLAFPLCCSEDEDVEHVFLRCPFARQVWALSHIPWALISGFSADSCGWVEHLAKSLPTEDFDRLLTICWMIWWNRNRALMERRFFQADELLSFALNYLTSFQQVSVSPGRLPQVPSRHDGLHRSVVWLSSTSMGLPSHRLPSLASESLLETPLASALGGKLFVNRDCTSQKWLRPSLLVKQSSSPVGSVGRRFSWKVTVLLSTLSCLRLNLTARTRVPLFGTLNL
ncbi:UNVERIFIED_CONTAM: hypothetical protein Sradi_6664700 [Sesamum radiatum]|uniref:Reverse transcriptase zinc-binding domain-containing protein n=1 Tax=Sesamum radiatum TaxID=300843 RepID=A0AAW2JR11_SESRA